MIEQLVDRFARQTTVYSEAANPIDGDMQRSALLKEILSSEPFSAYFSATSLSNPSGLGEFPAQNDWLRGWLTPTQAEIISRRGSNPRRKGVTEDTPLSDKATIDRMTLLARKYVAKESFSEEERARLAILTERVRKLIPAVSADDYVVLENALQELKKLTQENMEIRSSLGLG